MKNIHTQIGNLSIALKYIAGLLVTGALFYSFVFAPISLRAERKDCHNNALTQAQTITAQVQQQNENLEEGQEPQQVNDIAIYDTQFSLCLRSKGL